MLSHQQPDSNDINEISFDMSIYFFQHVITYVRPYVFFITLPTVQKGLKFIDVGDMSASFLRDNKE